MKVKLKDKKIKILGAGLSGLSAAINLAKAGKEVTVYELRDGVGQHIRPNFQALLRAKDAKKYLKSLNLNPKFKYMRLSRVYFSTRKRDLEVNMTKSLILVCRGGKQSLEQGLFREAKALGVNFEFNSLMNENEVDIVASGSRGNNIVAFGAVYENANFELDHYFMMYDDRFSPKGWYMYATPHLEGIIEIMNCVPYPYGPKVKELFFKALKKRKFLMDVVKGARIVHSISGVGNVDIPKTAVKNGIIYVGEAAGFQDPFCGIGMNYALESGKFAADSILYNKDYDKLWREKFLKQIKQDFARRAVMSVLGDRFVEFSFRKFKSGDTIDFDKFVPSSVVGRVLKDLLYRFEIFKKNVTGFY